MHLLLATIGKWKKGPERTLFDAYANRMRWPLECRELASYPKLADTQRRQEETALLFSAAKQWGAEQLIWLDETGINVSSTVLATSFGAWRDNGVRRICCLIGGDIGLDLSQSGTADMVLSLGALTWPHLLVRTLLAEQLYRVQTILDGHPYHRQ
ncbi:MAG: 23S rRNA (pseudouridine(1915)-N(3))-methyltransferase RlmH [Sphaerospermopsis sp. SIO1G2]|nr:23S rRNA (pseudouridine(1915)-N(3))-methyltransferase RlmH [Sphaerospermopsis sp. SIO1G2]